MFLATSVLSWYTFGDGAAGPTPPPVIVGSVGTQNFAGFGGGFLGPYHKRKREQLYANAELYGPPPVYRFNRRSLLPSLVFDIALPADPLLAKAARAPSAVDIKAQTGFTIKGLSRVKIKGLTEYYTRKKKKRQKEEDEMMMLL